MQKILVIEDDIHISHMVSELLSQNGYVVTAAYSGTEGLLVAPKCDFDVILLDLMLPGKSGEAVLEELRKEILTPVIVMTAKTDKESTTKLLRAGADDYLAKPFDNDELLARIEVQLRRFHGASGKKSNLTHKNLRLDEDSFDAFIGEKRAGLSKREYEILHLMMSAPNKVFTKNNLYESVWGGEFLGDDNTINVHISKLRGKLQALAPEEEYIQTVWGIGFKMHE